jgi:hypothetical protein
VRFLGEDLPYLQTLPARKRVKSHYVTLRNRDRDNATTMIVNSMIEAPLTCMSPFEPLV